MAVDVLAAERQGTEGGRAAGVAAPPRAVAMRILCAEDNPTNRRVLAALMTPLNPTMLMVDNGLDAVDAWERGDFDLIFMDIQMPVLDGVQATLEIRERERRCGRAWTPIVAVTANADPDQMRSYFAAGMDAVVAKPVAPAALYEAVATTLRSRPRTRAAAA
jgi:CheY-like chemotaxis protein